MLYPRDVPTVRFLPSGRALDVRRGARLIDVVREARLPIASACGDDLVCARCGLRVLEGTVARESSTEREAKHRNRVPRELRLACALRVQGDLVVSADYWGALRALVLLDHGSRRRGAQAHLEELAARVAAAAPGWRVRAAHLGLARPSLEEALDACVAEGARDVVVHPLFLAPGRHLAIDVPARVRRAARSRRGLRVRVSASLGEARGLAELIARTALGRD